MTSQAKRPDSELPEVDVAQADLPEADVPGSDVPGSEVPGSEVPGSEVPGSEVPGSVVSVSGEPTADEPEHAERDGGVTAERGSSDDGPAAMGKVAVPASPSATAVEEPLEAAQATGDAAGDGDDLVRLENEGDIAADYLEELLDIADLDGDLDMDVEGDRAAVSIVGGDVRLLVGRDGEVLEALQELTRLAVFRETGERSRLMLDVGGFRADKRSRLERLAADAVAEVRSSGERKALDAMTPFERKVVHDVVAAAGLSSASEGQEPRRYVVVLP